jgi:hypothetical protein
MVIKQMFCFLFNFSALCFTAVAQDVYLWQIMKNHSIVEWGKSSGDEFENVILDEQKWQHNFDWGKDSSDSGAYPVRENIDVRNGSAFLKVDRKQVTCRGQSWLHDTAILNDGYRNLRTWPYTAGMLFSKKKFLYGIYECKFKVPAEVGMWTAFWIYSGYPNKEIDMFETKGEVNKAIHIDIHNTPKPSWFGGWVQISKPLNDHFAVVRGQWDSNQISLSINNQVMAYYFGSMKVPGNLIASTGLVTKQNNKAVPSAFNYPIKSSTQFPNFVELDYLRIWEKPLRVIVRSQSDLNEKTTVLLSDTSLAQIVSDAKIQKRRRWKYKRYKNRPQYEIRAEVNKKERSIGISTLGEKDEVVKLVIEDSKGQVRFEVLDLVEARYQFATAYIGGNMYKIKLIFKNHTVEQSVYFSGND